MYPQKKCHELLKIATPPSYQSGGLVPGCSHPRWVVRKATPWAEFLRQLSQVYSVMLQQTTTDSNMADCRYPLVI